MFYGLSDQEVYALVVPFITMTSSISSSWLKTLSVSNLESEVRDRHGFVRAGCWWPESYPGIGSEEAEAEAMKEVLSVVSGFN